MCSIQLRVSPQRAFPSQARRRGVREEGGCVDIRASSWVGGWVGSGGGVVQHRGGPALWDSREQSGEGGEWSSEREARSRVEDGTVKSG